MSTRREPTPRSEAATPAELQRLLMASAIDRLTLPQSAGGRLKHILSNIGAFTLADTLTMGVDGLRRCPAVSWQGLEIGPKSLATIRTVANNAGWSLRDEHAEPPELHRYYDDILEASPAIALPTPTHRTYRSLGMRAGRHTIGDIIDPYNHWAVLPPDATPQVAANLLTFTMVHITPLVVEFETTRPQR